MFPTDTCLCEATTHQNHDHRLSFCPCTIWVLYLKMTSRFLFILFYIFSFCSSSTLLGLDNSMSKFCIHSFIGVYHELAYPLCERTHKACNGTEVRPTLTKVSFTYKLYFCLGYLSCQIWLLQIRNILTVNIWFNINSSSCITGLLYQALLIS